MPSPDTNRGPRIDRCLHAIATGAAAAAGVPARSERQGFPHDPKIPGSRMYLQRQPVAAGIRTLKICPVKYYGWRNS